MLVVSVQGCRLLCILMIIADVEFLHHVRGCVNEAACLLSHIPLEPFESMTMSLVAQLTQLVTAFNSACDAPTIDDELRFVTIALAYSIDAHNLSSH